MHLTSHRPLRLFGLVALAAIVVSPALATPPKDSFPLSNYPMFSTNKDPMATVDQVVGHPREGEPRPLPPRAVGTDEVLQARVTITRAVRGGRPKLEELCRAVATRVASDPAYADLEKIEIRTVTYDAVAWYAAGVRTPTKQKSHHRCQVKRG